MMVTLRPQAYPYGAGKSVNGTSLPTTEVAHHVIAVRGPVVDVRGAPLPQLGHVLTVRLENATVVLVVAQHLSRDTVRAIALQTTEGIARGMAALDTGSR